MSDNTVGPEGAKDHSYTRRAQDNGRIHKITSSPYAKVWEGFNASVIIPGLIGLTAQFGNLILQDILEAIDIGNKNDVLVLGEIADLKTQDVVQIQQLNQLTIRQDGLIIKTNKLESTVGYLRGRYANSIRPQ